MELNPSCSEATVGINLSTLSDEDKEELKSLLKRISDDEENWYETDWTEKTLFDMNIIEIHGDTPYNNSEWLEAQLRSLKCGNELVIEWD